MRSIFAIAVAAIVIWTSPVGAEESNQYAVAGAGTISCGKYLDDERKQKRPVGNALGQLGARLFKWRKHDLDSRCKKTNRWSSCPTTRQSGRTKISTAKTTLSTRL